MKRLFTLKDSRNKTLTDQFFETKAEAKTFRDTLNAATTKIQWSITLGPDHMGYHGIKSKLRGDRKS